MQSKGKVKPTVEKTKIPFSTVIKEWLVLIVGAVITVIGYKAFKEAVSVSYLDGESIGEQIGIILFTALPAYLFGSVPAGALAIKDGIFKKVALGAGAIGIRLLFTPTMAPYAVLVSGAGVLFPIFVGLFVGWVAYPLILIRRILGIFIHTEEDMNKVLFILLIAVMIAMPTLGYILPRLYLKGDAGAELGLIMLGCSLFVDIMIVIWIVAKIWSIKKRGIK